MKVNIKTVLLNIAWVTLTSVALKFIFNGGVTSLELTGSLLTGTFFGVLISWWQRYNLRKQSEELSKGILTQLEEGEILIFEDGANLFKGHKAIGGKMSLTNKRLIFTPYKHNIKNYQENFLIQEIVQASETKVESDINNALLLKLSNTSIEKFIVNLPAKWVENIRIQRQAA